MRTLLATTLATVLVASGCGGDSGTAVEGGTAGDTSGSGGAASGCEVVPAADIAEITEAEVADASGLPRGCQWSLADTGPTGSAAYDYQKVNTATYDANFKAAQAAGFFVQPVEDLGDEAFWRLQVDTEGIAINGELWVRSGDDAFQVRVEGIEYDDVVRDHQRQIAERILDQAD